MSAASPPVERPPVALWRTWSLHLLCFVLPVTTLVFSLSAPHRWWAALAFLGVLVGSVWLDGRSGTEAAQPAERLPGWPFDGILYALFALQLLNVGLALEVVATHGFWRVDTLVLWQLLGVTAGYSGIVVAHELMHRREPHMKWLARILMSLVLYEHFFTEHLRGHHVRVATSDDPATARFGEDYQRFFRRTLPAQFRSAWRLETTRLGDPDMPWHDRRLLRSRVVHGLVFEWALVALVWAGFGTGAVLLYLGQAFIAVRLLECVNFFEHWGLSRSGVRVAESDSWDTDSWFTLYTLVGLSRHADHHASPARPYPQLRHHDESPKLPAGYFGMVVLAFARPGRFRELMSLELERRGLGPFARAGH